MRIFLIATTSQGNTQKTNYNKQGEERKESYTNKLELHYIPICAAIFLSSR